MSVTLPGSILPTATATGSTLPSSVTGFQWSDPLARIDTCTPATFKWNYSGPQETLQFALVSNASPRTDVAMSRKRADPSTTLATNVDSTALSWTWPKVNMTAGQYVLQASGTDVSAVTSAPFLIINGADTSCLAAEVDIITTSTTLPTTPSLKPSFTSSEPSFTPKPTTSTRRTANAGAIAGATMASVVMLIIALLGYRVWARRRGQRLIHCPNPTEVTHRDLPSLYVASGIEAAPPLTEKGAGSTDPLDNAATSSPIVPNRRPPSFLLSEPRTPVPPYTSYAQRRERAHSSIMDASTIRSRSSAALSDATSTAGLMRTFSSSCPPSYLTSPSPPPSYVTDATRDATTPRCPHLSYASSS